MNSNIVIACALFAVAAAGPIELDWHILGGSKAKPRQFPYQTSLRVNNKHNCGGSILNQRWILTAAHCLEELNANVLTVVVGSNLLNSGGVTYQVDQIINHEKWNWWGDDENDIGLVKVSKDIEFNANIQPIELNEDEIEDNVELTLSGWGFTSYPGTIPNELQFIQLKSIKTSECQAKYSNVNKIIDGTQMCTLTTNWEGANKGDSGGPLVFNKKICGIVSCGVPGHYEYPDIFTRVSSFIDWIKKHIQN